MIPKHRTFPWDCYVLAHLDHPYNTTIENERAVEVPIAQAWLANQARPILEVGNVLGHYPAAPARTVVDQHEQAPGVVNLDVRHLRGSWPTIVSISTVEHIDPHRPREAARAIDHMRGLLAPGGRMLLTVGFGQHAALDTAIIAGAIPGVDWQRTMVREPDTGDWYPHDGIWFVPYATHDRWAASVWIAELVAP